MGQDGSHGSWVTFSDPFATLIQTVLSLLSPETIFMRHIFLKAYNSLLSISSAYYERNLPS